MDIAYETSRRVSPASVSLSAIRAVTPGASPYTFTATEGGVMYVNAGTVSVVSMGRAATSLSLGLLNGAFPMAKGDTLTITYVVAPDLNWVPL